MDVDIRGGYMRWHLYVVYGHVYERAEEGKFDRR